MSKIYLQKRKNTKKIIPLQEPDQECIGLGVRALIDFPDPGMPGLEGLLVHTQRDSCLLHMLINRKKKEKKKNVHSLLNITKLTDKTNTA